MPHTVVTPQMIAHMDEVYAKGGFVRRRKGQRYAKELFSLCDFYNQQGEPHDSVANPVIARTEFLGTFKAGDHHPDVVTTYRAFAIVAKDGSRWAGYSRDGDHYVLCQNQSYLSA